MGAVLIARELIALTRAPEADGLCNTIGTVGALCQTPYDRAEAGDSAYSELCFPQLRTLGLSYGQSTATLLRSRGESAQ
jgi:hypothetical protein